MGNNSVLIHRGRLLHKVSDHFGVDPAYLGKDLQFCQEAIESAPAEKAIPFGVVKGYLLGLIDEWSKLGDRRYDQPNIQVYNHIRKELDDLEEYAHKHFPYGDCT